MPRAARRLFLLLLVAALGAALPARGAAEYTGPLIDAHSHLPGPKAIEPYAAAARRHNISRVVLLGVGGVQKNDRAWITAAARKYPDLVVVGLPVPDPLDPAAAERLDAELAQTGARALGEVHLRQVSRKIDRDPTDPAFLKILEVAARHRVPVVIHDDLDERATERLERALTLQPAATVVLAHAGESAPPRIRALLGRHPNLVVDLSGMHFLRRPWLARETGPLLPEWKALIERMPERFLIGLDVWAARLFEPAMLDRLMTWTRRILGELEPAAAERVAYRNAVAVFGLK
ncbi:MAG TPA: TatD family hydrolase [Candidatus Binatia bacterium]|nr:TatD family hydrolase [Candidatus Binatia bacterium]